MSVLEEGLLAFAPTAGLARLAIGRSLVFAVLFLQTPKDKPAVASHLPTESSR